MSIEAAYIPTPQEQASWHALKLNAFPDGSHDLLPTPESVPQKSAPFAFDLGREYQLAQEYQEGYRKYFIENAHYYAKESYGRVPVSEYEHKIMESYEGLILTLGPDNQPAERSYMQPVVDASKPEWYRRRSMGDVRWVQQMQVLLQDSQDGDTFVDLSPTEFDVTARERKQWGYGYHSFVRIHRVTTKNGQKKLVSRAVRNYLDGPEQEALFSQLTGEKAEVGDMLGKVEKVNPGMSQAYINALAETLYDNTPEDRKIIPPPEYLINIKTEREMDDKLRKIDAWLAVIYGMMQEGVSKSQILDEFRGWENAVRAYVAGETDFVEFEGMTTEEVRGAISQNSGTIVEYKNKEYETGANGCGLGSGFGDIERKEEAMTYESTSNSTENCPKIKCRKCGWEPNSGEIEKINKGKLTQCPVEGCGWKP